MSSTKIYIGSDHAGFELKNELILFLRSHGYQVVDKGPENFDKQDDYPDFIVPVAREVSKDNEAKGIVIGVSGQGEAIVANRFKGVRAVVYYGGPIEIVTLSRTHNDANVLSLGARFVGIPLAKEVLKHWLETPFSMEDRHKRRIGKIDRMTRRLWSI